MNESPLFILSIEQKDNHTFTIQWSDEKTCDYNLKALQTHCPCAKCKETPPKNMENKDVRAISIKSVGRYALQIKFTFGCSNGIYSYFLLRQLQNLVN